MSLEYPPPSTSPDWRLVLQEILVLKNSVADIQHSLESRLRIMVWLIVLTMTANFFISITAIGISILALLR